MDATDPYKDNSNFGRRHIKTLFHKKSTLCLVNKLSLKDVSLGSKIQV